MWTGFIVLLVNFVINYDDILYLKYHFFLSRMLYYFAKFESFAVYYGVVTIKIINSI